MNTASALMHRLDVAGLPVVWPYLSPDEALPALAQAFGRMSADDRQQALATLGALLPAADRHLAGSANASPVGLARLLMRVRGQGLALQQAAAPVPSTAAADATTAPAAARRSVTLPVALAGMAGAGLLGGVLGATLASAPGASGDASDPGGTDLLDGLDALL